MAEVAVAFLLENVKQLLLDYANSLRLASESTVKSKIGQTEDSIRMLQLNPSAQPPQRTWDHKIRLEAHLAELTYRFDNVKEKFATVIASGGSISKRFDLNRLKSFREINADIDEINRDMESHRALTRDIDSRPTATATDPTGHRPPQGNYFIRRREEIEHLMEYVTNKFDYRVVAIYGNSGSGKSVLASELYMADGVRGHFKAFAWVCVSKVLDRNEIMEILYGQLLGEGRPSSGLNIAELAERLYRIQQEKKCLIVLDDVRSSRILESLRIAFPPGREETSSKILITTQDPQVVEAAEIVTAKKYIRRLKCLTDEEGRDLLGRHLISEGVPVPEHEATRILDEIGTTVVRGCEGWPANIICFAESEEMKRILEQNTVPGDLEQLIPRSLLSETSLAKNYDVPHFLNRCFLYLGLLQDHNSQTQVEKQYLLWLADGLLLPAHCRMNETLMNVGERYLEELAKRGMVVVHDEEVPTLMRYHTFQLSLLMQELCRVTNQEVGEFQVVDLGRGTDNHLQSRRHRQFAINLDEYGNLVSLPIKDNEIPHVRCLLLYLKENQGESVQFKHLCRLFKFRNLRILDFVGFSFQQKKLLKGIKNLVLLRYLSFKDCDMAELPSSIGNLQRLLVLDLRVKSEKMVIPNVLRKLKELMHLYLPETFVVRGGSDNKLRLNGLTKLQTITNLDTKMIAMKDLLELSNICYLAASIRGSLEEIEKIVELMKAKADVRVFRASVDISDFDCYTKKRHSVLGQVLGCPSLIILHMGGYISQLPKIEIHSNLVEIVLVGSKLLEDSIRTLESFPKLRVLVLKDNAYLCSKMICSASGFMKLRRMELQKLENLECWEMKEGAMPELSSLSIINCGKLIMQPQELEFVKRVPKVKASCINETLKHNLSQVKGDVTFED